MNTSAVQVPRPKQQKPMIYGEESVLALLARLKRQTRRVVSPQPKAGRTLELLQPGRWTSYQRRGDDVWENLGLWRCPYGSAGDLIWVKERLTRSGGGVQYEADHKTAKAWNRDTAMWPNTWKRDLRSPMFMPRELSRITLRIQDVRVERLQAITAEDCRAEGLQLANADAASDEQWRDAYRELWERLNAKRGYPWATNPWVWVVGFEVVLENVSHVLVASRPDAEDAVGRLRG
jgi:hypothetical protein